MLKARALQTKIKHQILEEYIAAWGGIIVNGAAHHAASAQQRGAAFEVHLIYVDANAFAGRYDGEQEEEIAGRIPTTVYGSPIIGIQALDKIAAWAETRGVKVRTNTILVEIDPHTFGELRTSLLMAGFAARVKMTDKFSTLRDGEIAMVNADCLAAMPAIVRYTQGGRAFSLYFLDPYGPKALPGNYVAEVIAKPRHDVIINMPYQDLHKKTGLARKEGRTAAEEQVLNNYDRMFLDPGWRDIGRRLDRDDIWDELAGVPVLRNAGSVELELVDRYRSTLQAIDETLAVKAIGLQFSDHERTMFYLYLTTHDADGALAINKILMAANLEEHELRWKLWQTKQEQAHQTTMMFDTTAFAPPPAQPKRLEPKDIAEKLYALLKGQRLTRKQVNSALADTPYFSGEITRALTQLRQDGRAVYDTPMNNGTSIFFPLVPSATSASTARRGR